MCKASLSSRFFTDSAGAVIEDSDELDEYGLYKKAWDIDEEEPEV